MSAAILLVIAPMPAVAAGVPHVPRTSTATIGRGASHGSLVIHGLTTVHTATGFRTVSSFAPRTLAALGAAAIPVLPLHLARESTALEALSVLGGGRGDSCAASSRSPVYAALPSAEQIAGSCLDRGTQTAAATATPSLTPAHNRNALYGRAYTPPTDRDQ